MKIFPFLILLTACDSILSQKWISDTNNLKGAVSKIIYSQRVYRDGVMNDSRMEDKIFSYNEMGFLTSRDAEYYKGGQHQTIIRDFDQSGTHCTKETWIQELDTVGITLFFYDESNRLTKSVYHFGEGEQTPSFYRYNKKGMLTEIESPSSYDKDTSIETYLYDLKGRKFCYTNSSSDYGEMKIWKYDENGNRTEERFKILKSPGVMAYNQNPDGSFSSEKLPPNDPDDSRNYLIIYTYNKKNQVIRETNDSPDNDLDYDFSFVYNSKGDVSKELFSSNGSEISTHKICYKYDQHGNWIEKKLIWSKTDYVLEKRKIIYYE